MKYLILISFLVSNFAYARGGISSGGDDINKMVSLHCESSNLRSANGNPKFSIVASQAKSFGDSAVLMIFDNDTHASVLPNVREDQTVQQTVGFSSGHFELKLVNSVLNLSVNMNSIGADSSHRFPSFKSIGTLVVNGLEIFSGEEFACRPSSLNRN